jgi:hypothetical protein
MCEINTFARDAMKAMEAEKPRLLEQLRQVFGLVRGFRQKFEEGSFFFALQLLWNKEDYAFFLKELGAFLQEHNFIGASARV